MFRQKPSHDIFLLLLLLLHIICASSRASEDHHHHHHQQHQWRLLFMLSSSRRILHEPLFPITYNPPPPPQPLPPSSDWPFFTQPPPQPTTPPPTANASSVPARPNTHASSSSSDQLAETITVAVSAAVGVLAVLAGLVFIVRRHLRARRSKAAESDKLFGHESRRPREAEGPTFASRFLYLGTMEPSGEGDGEGRRSPHNKLASISTAQVRRPSPELQPLPPLVKAGRRSSPPVFSDEEEEGETVYYSPNGSSIAGSTSSSTTTATTNTTARGLRCSSTPAYSCRTSPKRCLSQSSSIPSPTHHSSPPSPTPALPFPTARSPALPSKRELTPAPPPPPPPLPPAPLKNYTGRFSGGQPPQPLPPPPPPPPPPISMHTKFESLGASGITGKLPALSNGTNIGDHGRKPEEKLLHSMTVEESLDEEKPRLKPLHWDKVRAPSDRATVWDQFKSSSFALNEDMMETLFSSNCINAVRKETTEQPTALPSTQEKRVLDPKKSQNIAILLRALNVTIEEVTEALLDGTSEGLGADLLETLAKMAPTKEEELKLREFNGDVTKLGPAERFLKAILDIPFAFKRVDAMLFRANFETEVNYLMNSYGTLEVACEELKNSRLFLKLLEAVLRTGNRINVGTYRGQASAFKLDALLKLVDVKGVDGKTTLLHFVVQEIIRSEGVGSDNASEDVDITQFKSDNEFSKKGLQVVAGLSKELGNVKKAAGMDSDVLNGYVSKLVAGQNRIKDVLEVVKSSTGGKFFMEMKSFLSESENGIGRVKDKEKKALFQVKEITEYFHGDTSKEEAHPLRIFMVVRDFLSVLDQVCREVGKMQERTIVGSSMSFPTTIDRHGTSQ